MDINKFCLFKLKDENNIDFFFIRNLKVEKDWVSLFLLWICVYVNDVMII